MAMEDWKLCVEWLVRCQVLSSDHKVARNDAQVFDLAQFIRDGVVLCHVLNHLSPGCINPKDFSQRPQMSQVGQLFHVKVVNGLYYFSVLIHSHDHDHGSY